MSAVKRDVKILNSNSKKYKRAMTRYKGKNDLVLRRAAGLESGCDCTLQPCCRILMFTPRTTTKEKKMVINEKKVDSSLLYIATGVAGLDNA